MKKLNCLILTLVASTTLTACGRAFQVQNDDASAMSATNILPNQVTVSENKISGPEGELSWSSISASEDIELSYQMKIPFGRVYKLASIATRVMSPFVCQWTPGVENESPLAYRTGEVPCGKFVDGNWKQIVNVPVEPYYDIVEGFQVYVSGANIPVLLSRSSRQGSYQESSLTTKSTVTQTSSASFGDDVSIRYVPQGTSARLEVCMNIPGATVTSSTQEVWAKAWKNVLGVKVSYDSTLTVNPGLASFDYARGCFAADLGWKGQSLSPAINFTTTQAPYLSNVSYAGLHLKINDWFLRLADNIMGFFKSSLRKSLTERIVRLANKMADQEIETGRWYTRVHGEEVLQKAGEKITQRINTIFTRVGVPSSTTAVRSLIADQCRLKKFAAPQEFTQRLETFCRDVINQIEIKIEPFAVDSASQQAGCYSHFARIHDSFSKDKWWNKQCQFGSSFSIRIPALWKDYQAELKQMLSSHIAGVNLPQDWQQALSQNNVDSYLLSLLLEEAEKQGYTQIVSSDWASRLPALLEQIRNRVGQAQDLF